jgi:tetratricopeptide (TPR) repeat protein
MSLLSLLSKEQGVTVVGACAAFDVFLHWDLIYCSLWRRKRDSSELVLSEKTVVTDVPPQQTRLTRASNGANGRNNINGLSVNSSALRKSKPHSVRSELQTMALRVGCLLAAGVCLVWFRVSMNYGSHPVFKPYEMRAAFHSDRSVRMLSFSNLYCHNAWLLLCPSALCCDWSLGTVPLVTSINDPRNLYSLALYLTLSLLFLHTLHSSRDRLVVGMAFVLLLLPFFPASGVLLTVGFVIAERILYLPSLGLCLLVAIGMRRLAGACPKVVAQLLHVAMACLLLVTAAKTVSRNKDWQTDLSLFTAGVKINPNNVKLRSNLGMELKTAGRLEEAQHQYLMGMEVDPDYGEVFFNYGNLLSDVGEYEKAIPIFQKSLENPMTHVKTLNNLATMHYRLGRWAESEQLYRESLEKNGEHETTYNNLASLYGATNRFKESEQLFYKAIELNPFYTEAYFNLGTLYIQMERYPEAERNLKQALELNPGHHGATNNLKVLEYQRSRSHSS